MTLEGSSGCYSQILKSMLLAVSHRWVGSTSAFQRWNHPHVLRKWNGKWNFTLSYLPIISKSKVVERFWWYTIYKIPLELFAEFLKWAVCVREKERFLHHLYLFSSLHNYETTGYPCEFSSALRVCYCTASKHSPITTSSFSLLNQVSQPWARQRTLTSTVKCLSFFHDTGI